MAKQSSQGSTQHYQTKPGQQSQRLIQSVLPASIDGKINLDDWEESYDSILGRLWINTDTAQQVIERELISES